MTDKYPKSSGDPGRLPEPETDPADGETKLEMARRHVRQAERHVERQRGIVAELRERGQLTGIALELLTEFEQTLSDHRASLARIEKSD